MDHPVINENEDDYILCLKVTQKTISGVIVFKNDRAPINITDEYGNAEIPCYVSFAKPTPVIGYDAKNDLLTYPKAVVYDIFDFVGIQHVTVKPQWGFKIHQASGSVDVEYEDQGVACICTPRDIMCMIILSMKNRAEELLGRNVNYVYLRNAKGMSDLQKLEIRRAAEFVGLLPTQNPRHF